MFSREAQCRLVLCSFLSQGNVLCIFTNTYILLMWLLLTIKSIGSNHLAFDHIEICPGDILKCQVSLFLLVIMAFNDMTRVLSLV